ncbi:MAG: hypothetical protein C0404_07855 [Verrucomicrobia bacterium]|nr:hypothetical protein [Verrucomicrobiota bacterium]
MNITTFLMLGLAFAYAVMPYAVLLMLPGITLFRNRSIYYRLFASVAGGTALLCLSSTIISHYGFDLYMKAHFFIFLAGLAALLFMMVRFLRRRPAEPILPPLIPCAIVLVSLAVRLAPVLLTPDSLGGDDARFHNILAQKILLTRSYITDWEPFANIPISYPIGAHVVTAFLAHTAQVPVHNVFNFLIVLAGVLTTGIIYLAAREIFHSPAQAGFSAACYALLPFWGSLDYVRWGGLPNAMAMLFLCFIVLVLIRNMHGEWQAPALVAAICVAAIAQVHHYTLMIAAIMFVFSFVFCQEKGLRRLLLVSGLAGAILCVPLFGIKAAKMLSTLGDSSIVAFREHPITVLGAAFEMNPGFVVLFVLALVAARKEAWPAGGILALAWFVGLFLSFVLLEYVYRVATLVLSSGTDSYTCLTPSRMATDMVYPMAILCGFLPATALWYQYRKLIVAAFVLFALISSMSGIKRYSGVGSDPGLQSVAAWFREKTPENTMIVGSIPHLEYATWRETTNPPLPASESRKNKRVTWKTSITNANDWLIWGMEHRRPVYFVFKRSDNVPRSLRIEFYNSRYIVAGKRIITVDLTK